MKKIYMILAAITLLSMSLNAQNATPAQKYKAVNKVKVFGQDKGQPAQSVGALRAPNRYNAANGEFLVGPYTTDDFSTTGKGLYSTTSNGRIDIAAILDRSEIEQYIGQEIVGYRFATTGKVSCYDFHVWIEGPNHYVTDIHTFNLQESGEYVDVSGTQWHEYYLDEPVAFAVPDSAITVWIGYKYYQERSTSDGYTMTPILVNPNSTSHYTYAYSASSGNFYDVTTTLGGDLAAQLIFKQANPTVAISPETQTINDAAAGTLTITGTNVEGNINVSLANTTDWYLNPTSFSSTGGDASVSYTGRALSASTTVTAEAANDNTVTDEATVNYVADLYIVTDNGVSGNWIFTDGTHMTNNDGIYTATFTANVDNTYILFARKLGNDVTWNTRYVFGPNSGGDWVWGEYTGGTIDVNDDDPIKLPNAGTYTITINANDGTFTITKETPVLTAPTTGTTVNVGTNEGAGASTTVNISGSYLTEGLTVSVTGTGFSVSPASISAADANAGATVTVTYDGTDPNATGTLTISSNEVSVTVDLTASYVYHAPELTAPTNNSTVNVGTNTGSGVSKTINIKGNYLTQDLTVTVSGTGFSVSRVVTVTAAEANAGKDIIVTYNGTNENATGTLTISSSEVSATVNLTASYSESGEITVANGTETNEYLPIYGYWYDNKQINQVIYPSDMLTDMQGKYITSVTFYSSHLYFTGGKYTVQVGETSQTSFSSAARNTADLSTAVATDLVATAGGTTMTITFDTPFYYTGGNLLMDFEVTETGSYGSNHTYFYGATQSGAGFYSRGSSTNSNGVYTGSNGVQNFLPKATFTYSSTAPLPPAVEGGLLRLHLLFCDQLKANIPDDNSHPDAYGYVLRWEPQGEDMKESGRVKVNIQKTDCEVLSAYTLDQIDLDKHIGSYDETTGTIKHDQGLTMDVITAQVEFDLSSSNDMLNYYYLQGKEAGYPSPDEFLSQLHRQENFTYREMWPDAPEFDEVYDSGVHHYFDPDLKTGAYGSNTRFMSYAPSVTTWGIQRRYFELDGKDNTYGAPVWKTSVGKVRMQGTPVAERQSNANNSVNWTDENGAAASIYVLDNIEAVGNLPHTDKTKVKFEPYMFRVFVESENGLLRNYNVVGEDPNNTTQPGEHIEGATTSDDDSRGPLCIWSGYVKYDEQTGLPTNDPENGVELTITQDPLDNTQQIYTFHKNKVAGGPSSENWKDHNAVFGALDALSIAGYNDNGQPILQSGINEKDLRVFVRFYYNVEGRADGHVIMGRAADADRPGNGSESPGTAPSPWTAVKEISYNGEVVSVTYVNSLGMQSDQPFEGVNIVVTRYSDGKVSTTKVLR